MGFFGISRNFLGVVYFKRFSDDYRPLSRSIYIAECRDSIEASVRQIASGRTAFKAIRRSPGSLSFDICWQFAQIDEMATRNSNNCKNVEIEAVFKF